MSSVLKGKLIKYFPLTEGLEFYIIFILKICVEVRVQNILKYFLIETGVLYTISEQNWFGNLSGVQTN